MAFPGPRLALVRAPDWHEGSFGMADVSLQNVSKTYPNGFRAVDDLSLDVADGEFMVLVGPSGCGKTTALRMIAGLEGITSGSLRIGGRVANGLGPQERDLAMVFQNYGLYPSMSVERNIGFALKLRKTPQAEMSKQVGHAARILGLESYLGMRPSQLSGGQRQRVAMGRAIVRSPQLFLMDEPLSNLDAKLRVQLRAEVRRVQRQLGVATVYVTHDQTEAMTMGDRVAVMKDGVLQQCDSPISLYENPVNAFVASFIGSPAMNLLVGTVSDDGRSLALGSQTLGLTDEVRARCPRLRDYCGRDLVVGMRPEHLEVEPSTVESGSDSTLVGTVEMVETLGFANYVYVRSDFRVLGNMVEPAARADRGPQALVARGDSRFGAVTGSRIVIRVATGRLHLFDPADLKSLRE